MLVQLPNGNDGLPADVGVLHYHGIRGSKLALDAVLRRPSSRGGEESPRAPDICFTPFALTEFGTLGGHATAFLTELAKHASASKGMHVGKLLASWRRKVSLADNIFRGLSAAASGVEAASSSVGMHYHAKALFTRAMGRKASPCFLERRVRRRLSPPRVAFTVLPRNFLSLIC
jgi:hypothetical protein